MAAGYGDQFRNHLFHLDDAGIAPRPTGKRRTDIARVGSRAFAPLTRLRPNSPIRKRLSLSPSLSLSLSFARAINAALFLLASERRTRKYERRRRTTRAPISASNTCPN